MVRVQLAIGDLPNRLTLKTILEADGHQVVEQEPDVVVVDEASRAVELARVRPTVVLASVGEVRDAVAAMRQGVYGYILAPFQPGEAGVMVERAARSRASAMGRQGAPAPCLTGSVEGDVDLSGLTLREVEAQHILATLRQCRYNKAKAARVLGIGRNTLWRKLRRIRETESREADQA